MVPVTRPKEDANCEKLGHGCEADAPTIAELQQTPYADTARTHWLNVESVPKVKAKIVKSELWDRLEKDDFSFSSLAILENLQLLEKYLWPGYDEESSNYHIILLAFMVTVKKHEGLPAWGMLHSYLLF